MTNYTAEIKWLNGIIPILQEQQRFPLSPHDVPRLREIAAALAADETPSTDERLQDAGKIIAKLQAVRTAAESLLECIDIDGSLIHSEACGCDDCLAIRGLREALKGTA